MIDIKYFLIGSYKTMIDIKYFLIGSYKTMIDIKYFLIGSDKTMIDTISFWLDVICDIHWEGIFFIECNKLLIGQLCTFIKMEW